MSNDPLDRIDRFPNLEGLSLRQAFTAWTDRKTLSPQQNARVQLAFQNPDFHQLWSEGNETHGQPANATPPPGTPDPGSGLTFDARKLSPEEFRKWRHENGF